MSFYLAKILGTRNKTLELLMCSCGIRKVQFIQFNLWSRVLKDCMEVEVIFLYKSSFDCFILSIFGTKGKRQEICLSHSKQRLGYWSNTKLHKFKKWQKIFLPCQGPKLFFIIIIIMQLIGGNCLETFQSVQSF